MNGNITYGVVLVPSVSHSLRAEKLVNEAGIGCKLIPTPRELSSDCGTALRFNWSDREQVQKALDRAGLEIEGVFPLQNR